MWKLLGSLVSSFLLLRDLFGYLIPGLVFAAMIVPSFFDLATKAHDALPDIDRWWWLVILLVACYVAGHILVALGFMVYSVVDGLRGRRPPGDEAELQYFRYLYPHLFIDADRRATVLIFRVGLPVALLAGPWWLPVAPIELRYVIAAVGAFMLYNGYRGVVHVASHRAATIQAAQWARESGLPPFRWSPE
ncbi:MAG: hypothetical protein JO128_09625 [Alphaproteobacteria bacterium]|nr:hypothetical protein [Alphaproteobacteria bacterium]